MGAIGTSAVPGCTTGIDCSARRYLAEVLSPARALLATREARGRTAREELIKHQGRRSFDRAPCRHLHAYIRQEAEVNFPLGWVLSTKVRRAMDAQVDAGAGEFTCLGKKSTVVGAVVEILSKGR